MYIYIYIYIYKYIYIYILFIYIVLVLSFLDLTTLCVSSAHFLFTNKCFKGEANENEKRDPYSPKSNFLAFKNIYFYVLQ